jgi:hypothetical protein
MIELGTSHAKCALTVIGWIYPIFRNGLLIDLQYIG